MFERFLHVNHVLCAGGIHFAGEKLNKKKQGEIHIWRVFVFVSSGHGFRAYQHEVM